jgi:hypothetical protein
MNTIAVDPGKTCGVVVLDDDETIVIRTETTALGAIRFVNDNARPDVRVAIEAFHTYPRYASAVSDKTALEVIGAVKFICFRRGIPLCLISPGTHKPFPKQYPAGLSKHLKDAYSVGVWAARFGKFQAVTEF